MSQSELKSFTDFVPAEVRDGKICRIVYYAKEPQSGELKRVVIKCNRMKNRRANLQLARRVCYDLNIRLAAGYNPFVCRMADDGYTSMADALIAFQREKSKQLRPDSLRCYNSFLSIFNNWLADNNLSNSFVINFSTKQAQQLMQHVDESGLTSRTWNSYLSFFKSFFNWCAEKEYCTDNPFGKMHKRKTEAKRRETIPPEVREQIRQWLTAAGQHEFLCVMLLCYRCLIRPKEILMLKIKDVDFEERLITIPPEVAKNHNERVVAMPDDVYQYISTLRGLPPELYLFSEGYRPGTVLKYSRDIGRTWQNLRAAVGFSDRYTFYSLKDTGITEMLEAGVPPKLVKELADHHSLEMTERYTHRSDARRILQHTADLKF